MLTVSHDGNSIISNNYIEIKLTKNMNNILNQNVNWQNKQGYSIFAKNNTIKIQYCMPLLVISEPYRSNFMTILDFFISCWWKSWLLLIGYFDSSGTRFSGHCCCRQVAIVETFKQEPMYALLACERQTLLLTHRRWGTFREEERLRLSDRNSILMM